MENINNVVQTNNVINKRIGTFTFGLTLILFGIIVIIQTFAPFDLLRYVLMLWPIVFISIGAETLYYLFKKNIQIKYDLLGIILTLFLVFIGGIFSIGNYAVNKILFDEKVQNSILQIADNNNYNVNYQKNCMITNLSNKPVNVKIIENANANNLIYFNKTFAPDLTKSNALLETLLTNSYYGYMHIDYERENGIMNILITQLPKHFNSLDITIYTKDKNSIKLENCTII